MHKDPNFQHQQDVGTSLRLRDAESDEDQPGSVFTKPFSRIFSVFCPTFCKFECNTTSDWLNRTV